MKYVKLITKNHTKTKRNYFARMNKTKIKNIMESIKFSKNYWDGDRKYGYGGYKYDGRWIKIAEKIIKKYKLDNNSKVIDLGCGKGFLLKDLKDILPGIKLIGFDISSYAIRNKINKKIKILKGDMRKKLPFKNKEFDLAISINCIHNYDLTELDISVPEIIRISKKQYISTESYRNFDEMTNLQCWALTCKSFFSKKEWEHLLKKYNYKGDFELIYFT
jgi:SAM-dependent methyltransferase